MVAEDNAIHEDVKEVQEDDNEIELNMLVIVMKITMRTSLSFEDLKILQMFQVVKNDNDNFIFV